jgi:hypothetical protein
MRWMRGDGDKKRWMWGEGYWETKGEGWEMYKQERDEKGEEGEGKGIRREQKGTG